MKIVTFSRDGKERLGFIVEDRIVDPSAVLAPDAPELAHLVDLRALIEAGAAGRALADRLISTTPLDACLPLATTSLAPPLMPSTILCTGSNYAEHNREKANTPISGKEPEFFIKTADCVIGPECDIPYDERLSRKLDAETELAIVIGKPGRHIPVAKAHDHIYGFTIMNDVTARERQVRRNDQGFTWYELGRSKAFDGSAPLGPCVVTTDEIGDPQSLVLRTRVNGELRQSSSTASMIWSCAEIIHFFSTNFTLRPGMVISTGTPAGTAWSTDRELGGTWIGGVGHDGEPLAPAAGYLAPGDRIESEVEGIGILRNRVALVS